MRTLVAILLLAWSSVACQPPVRQAVAADQPAFTCAPDGHPLVVLDAIEVTVTRGEAEAL